MGMAVAWSTRQAASSARRYDTKTLPIATSPSLRLGRQDVATGPRCVIVGGPPAEPDFTSEHRLASISELSEFAESGGLLAYGANLHDLARRAAAYVDKIIAGAKPADLPVERAERFELAVNLRAAQRLGLLLPPSLLLQATEVIA